MIAFELNMQNIALISITFLLIYKLYKRNANYFARKNVKFVKDTMPLMGYMYEVIVKRKHMAEVFQRFYNQFSSSRFFGVFEFWQPVYCIRDIELIRQIAIKDFDNFTNHRSVIDENIDKFFGKSLFILKDQKWRDMRSTLSPAFTGSKMRHMFDLIAEISNDYMKNLSETIKNEKEVEFKDLANRYAHDVIAKCAFGISINSLADPENDFFKIGLEITQFPFKQQLKFFGYSSFPKLMNLMKIQFFNDELKNYFTNLVRSNMEYREKNNVKINDVINLLMQAKKHGTIDKEDEKAYDSAGFATVQESDQIKNQNSVKISKWSYDDMTAQLFLFFIAGFDTVSTAMIFLAYELSINPKVMKKLSDEIDSVLAELNGKLPSYEVIQKMEYLDMVVSESLRKWPPVNFLDRRCNKATVIEDYDGSKVQLEPNDGIFFPIKCIHMDPNYFANPEQFDPERFSHANRDNIKPFTYIPFGVGPRNCIGNRFALMEIKALFFSILSHFTMETCSKTEIPLKLKADTFQNRPQNGIWLKLKSKK